MTDDLDTLRPEVQKALDDLSYFLTGTHNHDDFYTIRAELLRLARENAELRRAWDDALLTGTGILKVERVDPATVMLPVAPRQGKGTPVPQSEHEALTERAEKAEAELLRLADDCARLVDCINAQPPTRRSLIDRAERAEAELAAALKANRDCVDHFEQMQAELAALKERIAGAPVARVSARNITEPLQLRDADPDVLNLHGKRVRLVVEE